MSLTEMVSSLIWRSRRITSRWRKNISPSSPYHLSKYCWQIFLRSSVEALSRSALVSQRSAMTRRRSSALRSCSFFSSSAAFLRSRVRSFFLRSGVMNPFFLAILMCVVLCAKKQTTGSCTSCSVESRERSDFYFGCSSEQSSWLLLSFPSQADLDSWNPGKVQPGWGRTTAAKSSVL